MKWKNHDIQEKLVYLKRMLMICLKSVTFLYHFVFLILIIKKF